MSRSVLPVGRVLLTVLAIVGLTACATSKPNPQRAPVAVPVVQPAPAAPLEEALADEEGPTTPTGEDRPSRPPDPPPETRESDSDDVVVIDPGGREDQKENRLSDLAAAEKRRRQGMERPVIVVTDENLAQHAEGGRLTFSEEDGPSADSYEFQAAADQKSEQESYWRERILSARQNWAAKVDEIFELESRANELRLQFYAADDPFYRDARIKPEWDRTLDRLSAARRQARDYEEEVTRILAEGGRAGALPGWLREGTELEPEERPYTDEGEAPPPPDASEPQIIDAEEP